MGERPTSLAAVDLAALRKFVAERLGLRYAEDRTADLIRGLQAAATELGYPTAGSYWLALNRAQAKEPELSCLARHLTVGETYFFREPQAFAALEAEILPQLLAARRAPRRPLRIWSAGCASGEEPYSIALTLRRCIPDLSRWGIQIIATDVNTRLLEAAREGSYRAWSFRETPGLIRDRYFQEEPNKSLRLNECVRRMVHFVPLNLAARTYPPPFCGPQTFDLIFCRNVLLYLTPDAARAVLERLGYALAEDGWLITGAADHAQPTNVAPVAWPGTALFRKAPVAAAVESDHAFVPPSRVKAMPAKDLERPSVKTAAAAEQARAFANAGRLEEALLCCDDALRDDRVNPALHYLRATVALERGDSAAAEASLHRALFLDPNLVVAHYTLATVALRQGYFGEVRKRLAHTARLLAQYDSEDVLPESDGLTAGRLARIIEKSVHLSE